MSEVVNDRLSCGVCGQPVRVVSDGEGTTHYEGIYREALARINELLDVVVVTDGRKVFNIFEAQRAAQEALREADERQGPT